MMMMVVVLAVLAAVPAHAEVSVSDEQYYRLPPLFHLDDYEACLSQPDAVYCVGSFELAPASRPNPLYDVIEALSRSATNFNHTLLHRGYCVSSRCESTVGEANLTRRFEECASLWTERRAGLRARLLRPVYCSRGRGARRALHQGELVYLGVLGLILAANGAGTAYHLFRNGDRKANVLLLSWSVPHNWRRLLSETDDPRLMRLRPLDGFRAFMSVFLVGVHGVFITFTTYLQNPLTLEKVDHTWMSFLTNMTLMVELYVVLSSFVFAHNILLHEEDHPDRSVSLRHRLYDRLARIAPAYWLVVGFAATWWPRLGSGPLWAPLVEAEAAVCRRKWWPQVLFLNNLIDPDQKCLMPTWFLASDLQLHALWAVLFPSLVARRGARGALPTLMAVVVCFAVLVYVISRSFDVKEFVFVGGFEYFRGAFVGNPSFGRLYVSWWGNAAAGALGLGLAVAVREWPVSRRVAAACRWCVPLCVCWVAVGAGVARLDWPPLVPVYTALARPVGALVACLFLYGMCNDIDVCWRWVVCAGWRVVGRLSLSVSLVHWCINMSVAASRPQPTHVSLWWLSSETVSVWLYSHMAALALTLLVQYPAQTFLRELAGPGRL